MMLSVCAARSFERKKKEKESNDGQVVSKINQSCWRNCGETRAREWVTGGQRERRRRGGGGRERRGMREREN